MRQRAPLRARLDEQLGNVDDVRDTVILEMRAAAGRVGDDVVVAGQVLLELAGARDPLLEPAGVRVQRAAAALRARDVDVEAVGVQNARRRGVDVAEDDARDAAGEQRHLRSVVRQVLRRPLRRRPRRRDLLQRPQRAGRRQLAEEQRRAQPPPVRKHREDAGADEPVERPPPVVALDVVARLLDQPVVLHPGRTRADAGHAAEAAVEVLDHRVGQIDRAVDEALHQIDPSARRVHLLVPERVRRAGRQAEAAVDAVGDQLGLHIASSTRSASGLHAGSRACST